MTETLQLRPSLWDIYGGWWENSYCKEAQRFTLTKTACKIGLQITHSCFG